MLMKPALAVLPLLALLGCNSADSLRAQPAPSGGGTAASRCGEFAEPVVLAQTGDRGALITAKTTSTDRVRKWQETRFRSGEGPDLQDKALYDLPPSQQMTVCIYDGDFRPPVPAPPGVTAPTFDRLVALVWADNTAQVQLLTQRGKLPATGPE